jgi:hypothetical protein
MLFSLLLAQVPRPRHGANFTLDYICWSSAAALLLICIVTAGGIWKPSRKAGETVSGIAQHIVIGAACLQLAFSIYGFLSFATSR